MSEHTPNCEHIEGWPNSYPVPRPASILEGRSVMFIETPARAELIIRACEVHEELVAALDSALIDIDMALHLWNQGGTDPYAWVESAQHKLAKARGES